MQKHVMILVVTAVNAVKVIELWKQLNYKIKEL